MKKTSRFNYIKRGLAGVCAATMLTGLCAGSAFAAEGFTAGTSGSTNFANGTATTEVKAESDIIQISATVPTTVSAAVNPNGELTFPDAAAFKIHINDGSWAVKVSDVAVAVESGYTLATTSTVNEANNLYLAFNNGTTDVALKASSNTDAVSNLTQATSGASDMSITMKGKVHGMSYADAFAGKKLVSLTWTLAAK